MREADRFFRLLYKLPRTQMHGIAGNANALRERLYSVLEDGRDVHVHSSPGCFWCSFPCARLCGTRSVPCIFYIIQIIVSLLWCSWHGDVFCSALEAVAIISNEIFEILRACFRWRADNALRKKSHGFIPCASWCKSKCLVHVFAHTRLPLDSHRTSVGEPQRMRYSSHYDPSRRRCFTSRCTSSNAFSRYIGDAFEVRSFEQIKNPGERETHKS
jgi:hypothetical protein